MASERLAEKTCDSAQALPCKLLGRDDWQTGWERGVEVVVSDVWRGCLRNGLGCDRRTAVARAPPDGGNDVGRARSSSNDAGLFTNINRRRRHRPSYKPAI